MHRRREFSLCAAAFVAGSCAAFAPVARAQSGAFKEGTDYLTLDKPAPVDSPAGQVEVVEFFWYSCSHCNSFEPQLDAWSKKQAKDVVLKRTPIAFRPDFEPQQRLYYVLEALGKLDELHKKVFAAIHVDKNPLASADEISTWAQKQGLNKAKFVELYNSFSVSTKTRKATQLQGAFNVDGVPALGVAGRYYTSGSMTGSMPKALAVVDALVALARKPK